MSVLNTYIKSVSKVGQVLIERVLARGPSEGQISVVELSSSPDIVVPVAPLTVVDESKINYLFSAVARRNKILWDGTDNVDRLCRRINEVCNASDIAASKSIMKTSAMLEGILQSAARGTSLSKVHSDSFNDTTGTDSANTTAMVKSGQVVLQTETDMNIGGKWSVMYDIPKGDIKGFKSTTGAFTANFNSPSMGASTEAYTVATNCVFSSPTYIYGIELSSGPCDVDSIKVFHDDGTSTELLEEPVRISGQGTKTIWASSTAPVKSINIKYVKRHYTSNTTQSSQGYTYDSNYEELIGSSIKEVINTTMMSQGTVENIINTSTIVKPTSSSPVPYGDNISYNISVSGVRFICSTRKLDGIWRSRTMKVNGDVRYLSLISDEQKPAGTNIFWQLSVEGSPWIELIPYNQREIKHERLKFDVSLVAKLNYPADPSADMSLENETTGTKMSPIVDSTTGYITAIEVDKPQSPSCTLSYTTPFSGVLDLQQLGLSIARSRLVDATSNGELGEWYSNTTNQRITLTNQPSGELIVFVRSKQATQIDLNDSLNDPDLNADVVYFKLAGRTLLFDDDYESIHVYYKYLQTAIQLRANLTTTEVNKGNTPSIDSLLLGIRMETI